MIVTVEGLVTSIQRKVKDDKVSTELMLAQDGEQEQVRVRLEGDVSNQYKVLDREIFMGRLGMWKTRDGIGTMVMVGNE